MRGHEKRIEAYLLTRPAEDVNDYYKKIATQFKIDLKSIMSGPKNLTEAYPSTLSTKLTMYSPRKLDETLPPTPTALNNVTTSTKPSKSPPKNLTDLPEELLEETFKNLTRTTFFYNGHVYNGYEYGNIEDWLAISLTSKQFRRIALPMNTLSQGVLARAVYHIQLRAGGRHWSCSTCALPAWEAFLLRSMFPAPQAPLAGEGGSGRRNV
jgi:hypothetical protein